MRVGVVGVSLILSALPARAHAADSGASVRLSLDDQANKLWKDLPEGPAAGEGKNVKRLGGTLPSCAGEALRRTKAALQRTATGRAAVRSLAMDVKLEPAQLKELRITNVMQVADLFDQYLESSSEQDFQSRAGGEPVRAASLYRHFLRSRSDQVLLAAPEASCGVVRLLFEIRSFDQEPGRLYAWFVADGHCACGGAAAAATPGARLGRFRVTGRARLKPGDRSSEGSRAEVKWELYEPRYTVLAVCGPCDKDEREAKTETVTAQDSCGRCRPLTDAARGWEQEAARADARAAQAAAEGRTTAERTLKELAAAARAAAAEAKEAASRCEASCKDVPPLLPPPSKQAGSSGSTKKILLGGGAAAAVAGGVIAASGGSSNAETATREPVGTPRPEPTPTPTPDPRPTPTPDPTPTPRPTPTPPPPVTCPDIFGSYTGRGVIRRDDGCRLTTAISVTIRISGSCTAMGLDIAEPQGVHSYTGRAASDGSFTGSGGGMLQGGRGFAGTIAGQVAGLALTADETLGFTTGCPGLTAIYSYNAQR
jgi:hypothetical protein